MKWGHDPIPQAAHGDMTGFPRLQRKPGSCPRATGGIGIVSPETGFLRT